MSVAEPVALNTLPALHGLPVEYQRGFELGQVFTFLQTQPVEFSVLLHHDNFWPAVKLAHKQGYRIERSFSVEPFYINLTFTSRPAPKRRVQLYLVKE